jgi:PHD/YefM family antitoxin component YafN of YafNO toxin-antitoxin module
MDINPQAVMEAVKNMRKEEQEDFLETLLPATSSDYLDSIKEARQDYEQGRTYSHDDVFES